MENARIDPDDAVTELRDALRAVGIVLPSLGRDAMRWANDLDHIELGGCNTQTALRLADALRRAAEHHA